MNNVLEQWQARVHEALSTGVALQVRGGGSKDFYGCMPSGVLFDTREYAGIVSYEPTELVVTVRAGTPLVELEALLAERGQRLAFEPPHFGVEATVGGCVAAGLSGPGRLSAGALRDYILGVKIIDGRGDVLNFGGQVMKNVAGYDVSRLVAGSLGTLGLIAEVSLKVLPCPATELTLRFLKSERDAIDLLNRWGGQPLPLSASTWHAGVLTVRLSGAEAAVGSAVEKLGGDVMPGAVAAEYWTAIREQTDPFFVGVGEAGDALWRISVPTAAASLDGDGDQLIEWGGGLRWIRSVASPQVIRERATMLGGYATLFRGGDRSGEVFHPLQPAVMAIQRNLKKAFDPAGIFNPGRLYNGL